jgi:hypothetical protein
MNKAPLQDADLVVDGTPWILASCAEWHYFDRRRLLCGIRFLDEAATLRRLIDTENPSMAHELTHPKRPGLVAAIVRLESLQKGGTL